MSAVAMLEDVDETQDLFTAWTVEPARPAVRPLREARVTRRVVVEVRVEPEIRHEEDHERWDGLS